MPQSWIHCIRTFAKKTGKRPSSPSTKKTIKRHTNRVMIQFEDICTNKYLNIIRYQPYLTNLDWDHLSIGGLKSLTFEYLKELDNYPPRSDHISRSQIFFHVKNSREKWKIMGCSWHDIERSQVVVIQFVWFLKFPFLQINISFMEISLCSSRLVFSGKDPWLLSWEVSREWSCKRCDPLGVAF